MTDLERAVEEALAEADANTDRTPGGVMAAAIRCLKQIRAALDAARTAPAKMERMAIADEVMTFIVADARMNPKRERGWNDAVRHIAEAFRSGEAAPAKPTEAAGYCDGCQGYRPHRGRAGDACPGIAPVPTACGKKHGWEPGDYEGSCVYCHLDAMEAELVRCVTEGHGAPAVDVAGWIKDLIRDLHASLPHETGNEVIDETLADLRSRCVRALAHGSESRAHPSPPERPEHRCGVQGFAYSGDECPGCKGSV